jgi:hypothetical protein
MCNCQLSEINPQNESEERHVYCELEGHIFPRYAICAFALSHWKCKLTLDRYSLSNDAGIRVHTAIDPIVHKSC